MCGRFVRELDINSVAKEFDAIIAEDCDLAPSYNIAPTQRVAVVVKDGVRQLIAVRWGLIPSWADDPKIASKLINARAETVATRSTFKDAFRFRRCLVVADGFYEWKKIGNQRLPIFIRLKSGKPFGFAGLWEEWKSPKGELVTTCTVITTEANEIMSPIHNRMPVILPREVEDAWLDPVATESDLLELLKPYPSNAMETREVSTLVNSVAFDSPECLGPSNFVPEPTLFDLV